jgi:hypothetical protein
MAPIDKLTNGQAKWLTYLVWLLITLISGTVVMQFDMIREQNARIDYMDERVTDIRKTYTPLERHRADMGLLCDSLNRIDNKLDRLIERSTE